MLGPYLKNLREGRGISLSDLAKLTKMEISSLEQIELNSAEKTPMSDIHRVLTALKVTDREYEKFIDLVHVIIEKQKNLKTS